MSDPQHRPTNSGPGRILVAVYGAFALAACSRATVQLATKYSEAPLAYVLSAVAGVIYVVATVTLARGTRTSRRVACAAIIIEAVGVLAVGTASLAGSSGISECDGVVHVRDRLRLRAPRVALRRLGLAVSNEATSVRALIRASRWSRRGGGQATFVRSDTD